MVYVGMKPVSSYLVHVHESINVVAYYVYEYNL